MRVVSPRSSQPTARRNRFPGKILSAAALLPLALALTGCFGVKVRPVSRTIIADKVLDATLDQLLHQLAAQDSAIQNLFATVQVQASTGGAHAGQVNEIPTVDGYIFLRRPADLRMIMLNPLVRSSAVDMVSDGTNFKLYLSVITKPKSAIEGLDRISSESKSGLENLRPYMVRDALLIPTASPEELVSLTRGSRILPPPPGKKDSIEEPDYDIEIFRIKTGQVLETVRVIHFGRITLKPYQQDIYDQGRIVTTVTYDKYQQFGEVNYPADIVMERPIDELKLKIDISKAVFNGKLADDQFTLDIPANVPIKKM